MVNSRMTVRDRIALLAALGKRLLEPETMDTAITLAERSSPWFVPQYTRYAIEAISTQFLDADLLTTWLSQYKITDANPPKRVGIVMAGNLPLVGFHDFLCTYISGCHSLIKLSSKDDVLLPYILRLMEEIHAVVPHR
jgi:hypothetical protein